ncbi:MAG: Exodeoxyribonuclease 7 large subunit [Gemmatimonadetes bacterium]|nr:Exodeoxyribonuclease 7 large subunit [Gemmatimonadota bacterium]
MSMDLFEELGDSFPGATPASALPVGTLTYAAKEILEGAFVPVWVRGEVTDFKAHRNGHWYFCLRDAQAQIKCVVWSRDKMRIPASPDDGMQVTAFGQLTVYAARGDMQFVVKRMEAEGDGLRRKALELTRSRLEADGLLAPERKRALPRHPRTIAVITSPDGAALHDIVAVLKKRAPGVRVVVIPAAVQGETAPDELCAALDRAARWHSADLLIIGRGGGGRDDLWAFNEERVARALAASPIPSISAVGHEIDISICDLVADLRAPTPSAAAEAAVRDAAETSAHLRSLNGRLLGAGQGRLHDARIQLSNHAASMRGSSELRVERARARLNNAAGTLQALSPLATMSRGFAVARGADGSTLGSATRFVEGAPFELLLRDGRVDALARAVTLQEAE